jgi:predicted RNA binding protein YcfA (HicA-like mRNA interferase family)
VTIPGRPGDDLKIKTWRSILRQAGIREGNL